MGDENPKSFLIYDDNMRASLDERERRSLDQLRDRFDRVEVLSLSDQKSWCVRVVREAHDKGCVPLPLAAIGRTPELAAERLWRMSTFYDFEAAESKS